MKNITLLLLSSFIILVSCSKGSNDGDGDGKTPTKVSLVFPENNKKCTEGNVINPLESTVTFQWNASQNTDSYEVNLKNLDTKTTATIVSQTNSATIRLQRGTAYEWFVISKSNLSTSSATSDTWRFYNQGQGVQNYAPFPAEAVAPTRGKLLNTAGTISLEWKGADVDNDIENFEVFFGTTAVPTTSLGKTQQSKISATVTATKTYYWSVKTTDKAGNSSNSEVFDFKVK